MEKEQVDMHETGNQESNEVSRKNSDTKDGDKPAPPPREDYRTLIKHCHLIDGHQKATEQIKDLGILLSINQAVCNENEDKFVIGCYNHIAVWNRKTKDVQVHKREVGGKFA